MHLHVFLSFFLDHLYEAQKSCCCQHGISVPINCVLVKVFHRVGRALSNKLSYTWTGPEVIKLFSCSTQLSMKFFLLINVKMPTMVGILTFVSRKNSILGLSESEKSLIS